MPAYIKEREERKQALLDEQKELRGEEVANSQKKCPKRKIE